MTTTDTCRAVAQKYQKNIEKYVALQDTQKKIYQTEWGFGGTRRKMYTIRVGKKCRIKNKNNNHI